MQDDFVIKLPVPGAPFTWLIVEALYWSDRHKYIKIYPKLLTRMPGLPDSYAEPSEAIKEMTIDNATPVPVFHQDGTPVVQMVSRQVGVEQVRDVIGENPQDGTPIYGEPYPDYGKPVFAPVAEQITVGEYDKTIWEHIHPLNPNKKDIGEALLQGVQARLTGDKSYLKFTQTPQWLNANGQL